MPTEPWAFARLGADGGRRARSRNATPANSTGPARVREAIQQLGVRRVQHGVRAIEDPAVVQPGRRAAAPPLTSARSATSACASYPASRVASAPRADGGRRQLHGQHRRPPLFRQLASPTNTRRWRPRRGFTAPELAQVARNGWAVADITEAERRRMAGRDRPTGRGRERAADRTRFPRASATSRADKALATAFPEHSRVAFQRSFDAGLVRPARQADRALGDRARGRRPRVLLSGRRGRPS